MTECQKIVFKIAKDKLENSIPRLDIVSGAALGLNKDKLGEKIDNKYKNWAPEADAIRENLKEALRLLKIIETEV